MSLQLPGLSDDLDEIAASIPRIPRTYAQLRSLLALLPSPLAARTQGSFPVDEVVAPESAVDQVGVQSGIGAIPGSAIMDGAIGSGQIRDGAVTGAAFAATIRPVYLVTALPGLPDPLYPIGQFVYKTSDVPPRLYKNVANVWVAAIGPNDIQADSITAGQIAAGAIATSELAVGARLTGEVANETGLTPGVFIDSTGILIRSGKLTLQDEFGLTTLFASGFNGSWFDFITTGLYNSRFTSGVADVDLSGRTANLPYWSAEPGTVGTIQRKHISGRSRVRAVFSLTLGDMRLESDKVPCIEADFVELSWAYSLQRAAGNLALNPTLRFWTEAGAFHSDVLLTGIAASASITTVTRGPADAIQVPLGAAFVSVRMRFTESTTHNAGNFIDLYWASLVRKTTTIPPALRYNDDAVIADNLGSGTVNDYDPGAIDSMSLLEASVSGDVTLTGIVAPSFDKHTIRIFNQDASTPIVLSHDDAGSSAANRIRTPGGLQYLIGPRGWVELYYWTTVDRWYVVDTIPAAAVWQTYTPSVGGTGGATHSTATGSYKRLGDGLVQILIYLNCNGNGSGAADVTITTPTNPDRSTRQVLTGSSTGHGITNGPISLTAFTGGAGAVWDRIHSNSGAAMSGADYDSGGIIVLQGWYREA